MGRPKVRTAIFPIAGLGTRLLPATKAVPKELLPVLDTPLLQFALDEAREAGVERMVFVIHPSKSAIERYVRPDVGLAQRLQSRGKGALAAGLMAACPDPISTDIVFTTQREPLGLGHAVQCARRHALPGPVAVILPDDLIIGSPGCLAQMITAYDPCAAGHLVAAAEVPPEAVSAYGILAPSGRRGRMVPARGVVEKPAPGQAPSDLAVIGRYVLDPSVFGALADLAPGAGGEIQLTDAIATSAARVGLAGFRFEGARYDCGSASGLLAAALARARSLETAAQGPKAAA